MDVPEIDGLNDFVEVGRGGFGVVFRAEEPALRRTVAVKVLTSRLDGDAGARFSREGRAMGALAGHPNIIGVHSVGVTAIGAPFIVMAYHRAGSLASRLARDGVIAWPEVASIGVKLAGALETAHRAATLHRDVKPENVLVSDYGEPVLADFGIARIDGETTTVTTSVTASMAHIAPELLDGRPSSTASDVYSLGSTLFTLLAGAPPFRPHPDELLVALFLRVATHPVPDLRPKGVPDGLCAAIEAAMAKDPAERPRSAEAFGQLLQAAQGAAGQAVTPMALQGAAPADSSAAPARSVTPMDTTNGSAPIATVPTRSWEAPAVAPVRRRGIFAAAAVFVAVAVFGAILFLTRDTDDTQTANPPDTLSTGDTLSPGETPSSGETLSPGATSSETSGETATGDKADDSPFGPGELANPSGVAVDSAGTILVSDTYHHRLLSVARDGSITILAGTGTNEGPAGDGQSATTATIGFPSSIALSADEDIVVLTDGAVRRIGRDGLISTVFVADQLFAARSVAFLPDDTLLLADRTQVVSVGADGTLTTIAGGPDAGFAGDGGPGIEARFDGIEQIAVDDDGNVFVADSTNQRVRRIAPDTTVTTVFGIGESDPVPDGVAATATSLSWPVGVAVADNGTLFVSEIGLHRIRRVGLDGKVSTIAGNPDGYSDGFSGDGGPAVSAEFGLLGHLGVDGDGNVFVLDVSNNRVRRIASNGTVMTVA